MNTLINDLGEEVTAVGAPGSIERVKVEYPNLIQALQNQRKAYRCAVENLLFKKHIPRDMTRESILRAVETGEELEQTL